MKRTTLILFVMLSALSILAQQKAVTDSGKEVFLYDDGTWKYQNSQEENLGTIPFNEINFTKPETSTFLLKSQKFNVGVWINPKAWSFRKAKNNADAEYEFELKKGDLYGMLITEKVEIPLMTLKTVALNNAQEVAPDIKVTHEEYRMVNRIKVLMLQMSGTTQGIKFTYFGYYFSNTNGTVQFITYTSQNLFNEHLKDCETLLNGFVMQDQQATSK